MEELLTTLREVRDYFDRYVVDCDNPDTMLDTYIPILIDKMITLQEEVINHVMSTSST